ncbi:TetR/AcrR family transcriptional regulator [Bacteroidales bacterium OttesenSCG-928-C19]|nr:TetR/AcrR family transcriptional regulator [Bacteroidales bacterium OttesenSCG-928-C19]
MPKTTEQYNEIRVEKKQLIMDVALELFAKNGFKSTSISHIAEEAGISKGLMYNYFCSKEDLLKAVIINLIDEISDMIDPNHDKEISEEEALQFFDKYFDMLQKRTNEFKILIQICSSLLFLSKRK